jgi:sugar phosphate isomerase/epimerase
MSKMKIGIQVFGLRDMLEETPQNFEHVMRQIKEMGYDGVELAGLYGMSPNEVKVVLDKVNLVPISAHVPIVDMLEDAEKVARNYQIIGCRYIAIPYLPEEYRYPKEGYTTFLRGVGKISDIMKKHGLTLLYHNHDFEFQKMSNGNFVLNDIYQQISSDKLQTELDLCWVKVAGEDPSSYMDQYAGRCPIVHYKDFIKEGNPQNVYKLIGIETKKAEKETGRFEFRPVGFGQQIWDPIYQATLRAGTEWIVVEQDEHYNIPSIECARKSIEYLRILMS